MSKCQCSIDSGEGYGDPEAFSSKDRKANKEHKCCECNKAIIIGEIYRYESGIWEGRPKGFKTCLDCVSVRDTFFCSYRYGTIWDEFQEQTNSCDGKYAQECIDELTPAAKAKVLKMIQGVRRGIREYERERHG